MTPACPKCDAPMELKRGKLGPFWSCSKWKYTKCKGSRDATAAEKAAMPSPPPAPGPVKHWRRPDALYRGVHGSAGEDRAALEIPLKAYLKDAEAAGLPVEWTVAL